MGFSEWAKWKRVSLIVAVTLLAVYIIYAGFVSYSNGNQVDVTVHAGTNEDGSMYYRCSELTGTGASITDADQCTLTVHKRDKVTFHVTSDDGPGRTHDFKLGGLAYLLWPAGVEMELEGGTQSGTFTAWSAGTYTFFCELGGHQGHGMKGTLVVLE